ncbi:MAG: hypothetical protein L6V82_05200 [Clostridiales bacterium]|nr:MAG: hypothetical protein L6V82_05200 [Clostridiales bacterium]
MKQRKLVVALAVILVLVLAIGVLTACKKEEKIPYEAIDDNDIVKDLTYGVDYKTLYDQFGKEADASKLTFKSNGLAYQTFSDGKEYELGLDFDDGNGIQIQKRRRIRKMVESVHSTLELFAAGSAPLQQPIL